MNRPAPWLTKLRALLGAGALSWEFGVDRLNHWPAVFVIVFWLLGGPVESLIKFLTAGRLEINVRKDPEPEEKDEGPDPDEDEQAGEDS